MILHWLKFKRFVAEYFGESLSEKRQETLRRHVAVCADCRNEVAELDHLGGLLRKAPVPQMPSELASRLRVRLREERRRKLAPSWGWKLRDRLQPFVLPASVGLLTAALTFGIFVPLSEIPVHADSADVPLMVRTSARLRDDALLKVNTGMINGRVKLLIDQNGRVADVQILCGKHTKDQERYIQNVMLFAVFDPATVFGQPTTDTVVLSVKDGSFIEPSSGQRS